MFGSEIRNALLLGHALWDSSPEVESYVHDVVASISLLGLEEDRAAERAVQLLLSDAKSGRPLPVTRTFNQPFFRLFAEERAILGLLHFGKWSYARIGRAISETPERVEELAWAARVALSSNSTASPRGSNGASCPTFEPARPWVQAFLDQEPQGTQLSFLKNHLHSCEPCRAALRSAREIYYRAEKMIPLRGTLSSPEAVELERSYRRIFSAANPLAQDFVGSLQLFFTRKDARILLAMIVGCVLIVWLK